MPSACFVLLNPDLEDTILSYTFGITTSASVRSFVGTFEETYYYRGAFRVVRPANRPIECGCILRHWDGPWEAHGLSAGGFERIATFDARPSREELANLPW